jgi:hypothetical protein
MKIYYAHHLWKYNTEIETFEESVIRATYPDSIIINPNKEVDQTKQEQQIMEDCFETIDNCDMLVFSTLSGIIGKGVLTEIQRAQNLGQPVGEIVANRIEILGENLKYNLLSTGSNRLYAEVV